MAESPTSPESHDEGGEFSTPLYSESSDLEDVDRRSSRCMSTDDPKVGSCVQVIHSSSESSSSVAVNTLLSKLRSPLPSELARKRKVQKNPPKGQKRGKGTVADNPKNVAPIDRIQALHW